MNSKIKQKDIFNHTFNLNNFEGPLDLLLHLAKTEEIEISDINLDNLIEQYINFIKNVEKHGLDVSSNYLEMAAELIRLKSQMLLPKTINDEIELEIENLALDKKDLIQRLIEYKQFKNISIDFFSLSEKRENLLSKKPELLIQFREEIYFKSGSIDQFIQALKNVLSLEFSRVNETKILHVTEISIEENVEYFKKLNRQMNLNKKFKTINKSNQINLFLAILEALKNQYITFKIIDENIILYPKDNNEKF